MVVGQRGSSHIGHSTSQHVPPDHSPHSSMFQPLCPRVGMHCASMAPLPRPNILDRTVDSAAPDRLKRFSLRRRFFVGVVLTFDALECRLTTTFTVRSRILLGLLGASYVCTDDRDGVM